MRCGPGAWRLPALVSGLAHAALAQAACLAIGAHPNGTALAQVAVADDDPTFAVAYVHSVTRTPVEERYRIDRAAIVQTEIRFSEHGPGLPTQSDAGGTFSRQGGRFVVTMHRRMDAIVMRVHADQSPQLVAAGRTHDLAAWGNRSLALSATTAGCAKRG